MIHIHNLCKSYGSSLILDHLNLDIEKGETVVIVGGSGTGKSTLLRCINRLTTPDKGEVWIQDRNIHDPNADVDDIRRGMGMVYQQFNLFSHLNVLENVILAPTTVLAVPEEEAIDEARELLSQVGMLQYQYSMTDHLSGGQKQRVAIARALAMHPAVMLFDEPTSSLDPTMVDEVENVIQKLVRKGMTSIIVTHDLRFAKSIASRVIFLAEHGIYESGTPKEIFENPKKPLTRQFLYRSRMSEMIFNKETFDSYEMQSQMKQMVRRYDHTHSQTRFFAVLADELIFPILNSPQGDSISIKVSLTCSETSTGHMLVVKIRGIEADPLESGILDELNIALLEAKCTYMFSSCKDGDWKIAIQL